MNPVISIVVVHVNTTHATHPFLNLRPYFGYAKRTTSNPPDECQRGVIGLVNRTDVLEECRGHYMNRTIDLMSLTVRELGDAAAERGVSASSLLAGKHPHIIWPEQV